MLPIALHGFGQLVAWHFYFLSYLQARDIGEQEVLEITFDALDADAANFTLTWRSSIADVDFLS